MGVKPVYPSSSRAYATTAILSIAYAFSYFDRQLPNLLISPIKQELALSDTQVSLLSGLSFAVLFSIAALPLARIADAWSRKGVICAGIALWGGATALCGFAGSFGSFFVARMGVGLGEAGLTPAAYSLLGDLFPPERRGRATGLFVLSAAVGTGLAMLAGGIGIGVAESWSAQPQGWFAGLSPWRILLIVTGLLTLLLVPLALLLHDPRSAVRGPSVQVGTIIAEIWGARRAYLPLMVAIPLINIVAYGSAAWIPTFFIRAHGWTLQAAGLWVGAASILGGVIGGVVGGGLIDRLRRTSRSGGLLYCVYALVTGTIATLILVSSTNLVVQLGAVFVINLLTLPIGIVGAVSLQDLAPQAVRAQVSALYLLVASLVGVGCGPTAIALVTDYVLQDEMLLGRSLVIVWVMVAIAATWIILANRKSYEGLAASRL